MGIRKITFKLLLALALGSATFGPKAEANHVRVGVNANFGVVTGYPYIWAQYPYYGYWGWNYGYPFVGYSFGNLYPYPVYPVRIPTYGAITYSITTKEAGWAWGYDSADAAATAANSVCGSADCKPVVWVQGGCAALSVAVEGQRVGWAYSGSKYGAQSTSLRICQKNSSTKCEGKAWVCSF